MRTFLLWTAAVAVMFLAASYQRTTGPTYPLRGEVTASGESYSYRLIRSQETTEPARVAVPRPGAEASGSLTYRRYPTGDAFTTEPLVVESGEEGDELVGYLPVQPAAGKVEYRLELTTADGDLSIPAVESDEGTIVLRYKDPVPGVLLGAHVVAMFFTVLIGMRTGLGALFAPETVRPLAWTTLTGMTVGGLVLGPFVQKYAFGAYWTGFPWGYDLTDNKLLIMWVVWLVACMLLGGRKRAGAERSPGLGRLARGAVLTATIVMTAVYLIPHSMRGSELDYGAVDAGAQPSEAVGTGRN